MKGLLVIVGAALLLLAIALLLGRFWERGRLRERYEGVVVGKETGLHQMVEGPSETLWVLEIRDKTGKQYRRLVSPEFYNQVREGDRVRKDPGSEIRLG